ncbi:MAG: hypothetical protein EXR59_03540 [Dehalococcoidia bacterium]|nr:hypothetical protein [Dehalococcoidia bacterium]
MTSDGNQIGGLTSSPAIDQSPRLSPDGSRIAFQSNCVINQFQIFVMDLDGENVYQVTSAAGGNFSPTWSSDGKR